MNKKIILIISIIIVLSTAVFLFRSLDSYRACGCGCCGGEAPGETRFTFSPSQIIKADKESSPEMCALAGCSMGIRYVYFNFTR